MAFSTNSTKLPGSEIEEACNSVAALLRLDPNAASDASTVHSIQLAIRRLLVIVPGSDPSSNAICHEYSRRQLQMLTLVLRHFGPSPLRSLRLLIAELIFRCLGSPSARTRKLSGALHKWFLVLFGTEVVQQRCEFLAVGLVCLLSRQLGLDFQATDLAASAAVSIGQQNNEGNYDALLLANKSAIADCESRLNEQLAVVSPIDLLCSYSEALTNLLSPIAADGSNKAVVDLYLPSLLAVFDKLGEAFVKNRSSHNTLSAAENLRINSVALPLFELMAAVTKSSFRSQMVPASRRIFKTLMLAHSMLSTSVADHRNQRNFVAWGRAFRFAIEAFGFRVGSDENILKNDLELLLKELRWEMDESTKSPNPCLVINAAVGVFSAILTCSVPAQRTPAIDSIITSALQTVVFSLNETNNHHVCAKCSKTICSFVSAGILSPPFRSAGVPSPFPTLSSLLSALSSNTRHVDADVSATFASTLSNCLVATAHPVVPPLFGNLPAALPPSQLPQPTDAKKIQSPETSISRKLPLFDIPPAPALSKNAATPSSGNEQQPTSATRRRLRSQSPTNNIDSSPSSTGLVASDASANVSQVKTKRSRQTNNGNQLGSDSDDDVIFVSHPDEHGATNVGVTGAEDELTVANQQRRMGKDVHAAVDKNASINNIDPAIDGLFSTFVAVPPDAL